MLRLEENINGMFNVITFWERYFGMFSERSETIATFKTQTNVQLKYYRETFHE